jgi:hypothetical protein
LFNTLGLMELAHPFLWAYTLEKYETLDWRDNREV